MDGFLGVRLDQDTLNILDEAAELMDTTRSEIVRHLIDEFLARQHDWLVAEKQRRYVA